jgi:energy-coupling factor transporter ATP-binding protein EcfA2
MNVDQLLRASDALQEFQEQLQAMPEETIEERAVAALQIALVNSYLVEVAAHLAQGEELHVAMLAMLRGEQKLSPEMVVADALQAPRNA